MGRGSQKRTIGSITAAVVLLGAASAVAQTPNSSPTGTIGLTSRLEIDNNRNLAVNSPGTTITFNQDLSFSLQSVTRSQILDFSAVTGLRARNSPGGGTTTTISDPRIRLRYFRESANSNVDIRTDYVESDVTSSYDANPTVVTFIVVDTGTLVRSNSSLTFNTGIGGPLQLSADARIDFRDYSGTSDPALFDNTTYTTSASANMRLSPVTDARLRVRNVTYDSTDAFSTEAVTNEVSGGLRHELRQGLIIDGNLGFRTKDTTVSGTTTTIDGLFGGVNLTQARPDGDIFGGISFDFASPTDRTSLTFGRDFVLPNGSLSASLTATDVSGTGLQFFGNANYQQTLSTGSLTVDLDRSLTTDQNNNDIAFTRLGLGYQQALTSTANLNLGLDISRSEDGGAGSVPTRDRATLTASYTQPLTKDWNMSLGYRHRRSTTSTTPIANSDTIFMTLSRNIQFAF